MLRSLFIAALLSVSSLAAECDLKEVYLVAPDLSDEAVIGYNVGVRPYRKSGVRLEADDMDGKILIHNYGYGGSGLTLSLGGATLAADLLQEEQEKNPMLVNARKVAILGAGVIGLATAYELSDRGYEVHIYADEFSDLTSNVAAGIWSPAYHDAPEKQALYDRMLEISQSRFLACTTCEPVEAEFKGVRLLTGYRFPLVRQPGRKVALKFKPSSNLETPVCVHFSNGVTKVGLERTDLCLEGNVFMADLLEKVLLKGVTMDQRIFQTHGDVEKLSESLIINCTSLGSRELFGDDDFVPIRGQLVYVKPQPEVDYWFYQGQLMDNYWTLIYPWSDRLILNGVFEEGEEETTINPDVIAQILENARACFREE